MVFEFFNKLKHEHICFIQFKLSVLLSFVLPFAFDFLPRIQFPFHGGEDVFTLRESRSLHHPEKLVHSTFITVPMRAFVCNMLGRLGSLLGTEHWLFLYSTTCFSDDFFALYSSMSSHIKISSFVSSSSFANVYSLSFCCLCDVWQGQLQFFNHSLIPVLWVMDLLIHSMRSYSLLL